MDEQKQITRNGLEVRNFPLELRVLPGADGPLKIVGYVARFNSLSEDLGGFREIIMPGAFTASLKKNDMRSFFNHNPDYVIGRQSAGTASFREDQIGLYMEAIPPDTQWARDLLKSIERGDISGQSFAFRLLDPEKDQTWEEKKGVMTRTLLRIDVREAGPVSMPAYTATDVSVALRSMEEFRSNLSSEPDGSKNPGDSQEPTHRLDDLERDLDLTVRTFIPNYKE